VEVETGWHELEDGDAVVLTIRQPDGSVWKAETVYAGLRHNETEMAHVAAWLYRDDFASQSWPLGEVVDIELLREVDPDERSYEAPWPKDGEWVRLEIREAGAVRRIETIFGGVLRSPGGETVVEVYKDKATGATELIPFHTVVDIKPSSR
jgi:hypothetical protein